MQLKCLNCGSYELDIEGEIYACPYCQFKYTKSELETAAKNEENAGTRFGELVDEAMSLMEQNYKLYLEKVQTVAKTGELSEQELEKIKLDMLNELEITSEFLLKNGEDVAFAGRLYSSIEDTLKNFYKLRYIGSQFAITPKEYDDLQVKTAFDGKGVIYPRNDKFKYKTVRAEDGKSYGVDEYFEMTPIVRFLQVSVNNPQTGLSSGDVKTAAKHWGNLNAIRHNREQFKSEYIKLGIMDKHGKLDNKKLCDFWLPAWKFFNEHKLCSVK